MNCFHNIAAHIVGAQHTVRATHPHELGLRSPEHGVDPELDAARSRGGEGRKPRQGEGLKVGRGETWISKRMSATEPEAMEL